MIELLPLLERQIFEIPKARPTLIFPEGEDPRILSAASRLTNVADVVLVGSRERAESIIAGDERPLNGGKTPRIHGSARRFFNCARFVEPAREEALCEELLDAFFALSQGKRWFVAYERARELIREPVMFSCMAVRLGYADAVLGGVVHTSQDFFRPALRLLHTSRTAFEVALFSLPAEHRTEIYQKNLVAFADVAVNPDPSPEELAEIAVGACKIVRDLVPQEVLPYINGAILSYSTRGSGEGESVRRIRRAGELIPPLLEAITRENPLYQTIRIEAELQMSCAISIAAAQSKLRDALADPASPVGRANVLIVPSLDSGNILYHLYATRYPDSERVLMVGGMNGRVLDFSRSSTAQDVTLGGMATALRIKRRKEWSITPRDHFFRRYRILVANPGTTSTRIAVFDGEQRLVEASVDHGATALGACANAEEELRQRACDVEASLAAEGIALDSLDAVVGRGGLVRPVCSGTFVVNEAMRADLLAARFGEHPSNFGPLLAHYFASSRGLPAFTVDPVVVDELSDVARVTGLAGYERRAAWHALSQKAVAKRYAESRLREYEELNLVVGHLGRGVTVGCHRQGRCFFVNDGLEEGAMTPERAGSLPHEVLLDLFYRKGMSEREVRALLVGRGGMYSLLGTSSILEVEAMMDYEDGAAAGRAEVVFEALAQGIAAEIAACFPRFGGDGVDQVLLTGGLTHSDRFVKRVKRLLQTLPAGVTVFPGGNETEALRDGALRVMRGLETALDC